MPVATIELGGHLNLIRCTPPRVVNRFGGMSQSDRINRHFIENVEPKHAELFCRPTSRPRLIQPCSFNSLSSPTLHSSKMPQIPPSSRLLSRVFTRYYASPKKVRQKESESWILQTKSSPARSYPSAIKALEALKSNRSATELFNDQSEKSSSDPNATAILEMITWLSRAGYTPKDLARMKHIHIAGTKGKGSVASYATSLLVEASRHLPVKPSNLGTYKSPHLTTPRERILMNGEPISEQAFARWFWQLWDRFTEAAKKEGMDAKLAEGPESKPFFFRFMTILAWHAFLNSGVMDVVMECGIGGEYDATNVLPKEAVSTAVVTSLGLDHTDMLGDTVEKIAWHKAGIFKEGSTAVVLKDERGGVRQVLKQRAEEKSTKLVEVDRKTLEEWDGASSFDDHIAKTNQTLAVMAVRNHLQKQLGSLTDDRILLDTPQWMLQAMKETKLPGVREVVERGSGRKIQWLLDGAHTKESLEGVAAWLVNMLNDNEKVILVFNQYNRDVDEGLRSFLNAVKQATRINRTNVFSHVFLFNGDEEKAEHWQGGLKRDEVEMPEFHVAKDVKGAIREVEVTVGECLENQADEQLREAREKHSTADMKPEKGFMKDVKVLVTGSFHLVGDVLKELSSDERAGWPRDRLR